MVGVVQQHGTKSCDHLSQEGWAFTTQKIMGWALQMRWLWIEKTKPERSWAGLKIPVHMNTSAMFAISVVTSVGNGENTMFWTDSWIHGC